MQVGYWRANDRGDKMAAVLQTNSFSSRIGSKKAGGDGIGLRLMKKVRMRSTTC